MNVIPNLQKRCIFNLNQGFFFVFFFLFCGDGFGPWPNLPTGRPPRWPSGKASASRAEEDPGLESRLRRDFFGVEPYQ